MERQERMRKIKKALNSSRLKESFLKVIHEKRFTITEEIPEAEGLWSHLGDPIEPLTMIVAKGKRKTNSRVPDPMVVEYQKRFNEKFRKNLPRCITRGSSQELVEAASDDDNVAHSIIIDEAIEIDGEYNIITICCRVDHQKLFKKILKVCINHRI